MNVAIPNRYKAFSVRRRCKITSKQKQNTKEAKTNTSTNPQKCRLPPDSVSQADSPGIGMTPRRTSGLSHSQVLSDLLT